ncbi:MAG: efflux RND transporter periplasmic adaptor subunit [Nitrospinota bacterium]|nr:efflux RND transporter periplasmic adaptor subunit [Nitrospinota bacterium]
MKTGNICFMLLLSIAFASCGGGSSSDPFGKGKQDEANLVEIVTVQKTALSHKVTRTGTLSARRITMLYNQEQGRIDAVKVYEGDRVKKGDILVKLDDRRLRASLAQAVAERKKGEADYKRIGKLAKNNITTKEKILELETIRDVAKAAEQMARIRVDDTEIRAPYDGIITVRNAEPGVVAPVHTHLITILDRNSLYSEVTVSELSMPLLAVGNEVEVMIDAIPDRPIPGVISRIHPTIDPNTRLGKVEVALTNIPEAATAGQLCRVTIQTPQTERTVIPFAAMRRDSEGTYVYIVNNEVVERQPVRPGLRFEDLVEILEGLEPDQQIVSKGFLGLGAGKKVVTRIPSESVEKPR